MNKVAAFMRGNSGGMQCPTLPPDGAGVEVWNQYRAAMDEWRSSSVYWHHAGDCFMCRDITPKYIDLNSGYYYCDGCRRDHPTHKYVKATVGELVMGVENEVMPTSGVSQKELYDVTHNDTRFEAKDDCSLEYPDGGGDRACDYCYGCGECGDSVEGVEYTFGAFTWDEYLKGDVPLDKLAPSGLITDAYHHDIRVGTHVHLNTGSFTRMHLWKFMHFVYTNLSGVYRFAGREAGEYCSEPRRYTPKEAMRWGDTDKYRVISMRGNTVEVRVFNGATEPVQLARYIEWCHALFEYTKVASATKMTYDEFVNFVHRTPGYKKLKEVMPCV